MRTTVQVDNDTSTAIPDDDPAGVELDYVVAGAATDVVAVRWSGYITHTFPGDLSIDLKHPDGTTVRLFDQVGEEGTGLGTSSDRMRISSSEAPRRPSVDDGVAPFAGRWAPSADADLEAAFAGKSANGTWTLTIIDHAGSDTGTHHDSSLFIDRGERLARQSGLEWHITGLWYPGQTSVAYYGRIADPIDGDVGLLLDDSRSIEVTFPTSDPIVPQVVGYSYERCVRAYYRGRLVYWAPFKIVNGQFGPHTITLRSVDTSLRLIKHFLRRGDLAGALSASNDDRSTVTVDQIGLRLLRDAANNTPDQTDRGVPDLGIIDGRNDFTEDPTVLMGVSRGQEVFAAQQQISQAAGAPDFELEPVEDIVGAYAQLNTFTSQGDDISAVVAFHHGTGKQNLEDLEFVEGSEFITHVHVLSRDLKRRVTVANAEASAAAGVYVAWVLAEFDAFPAFTGGTDYWAAADAALEAEGNAMLQAYGRPLITVQLTLPVETDDSYQYGRDYKIGDIVGVAGRDMLANLEDAAYRITAIRLHQSGPENLVQPSIEVIPDRVTAKGDGPFGSEE